MLRIISFVLLLAGPSLAASAQTYKQLPPPGVEIDARVSQLLRVRVEQLQKQLDKRANKSATWRPDVEVLVRAVRLALDQNLFFKKSHTDDAKSLLVEAERRLKAASNGLRGLRLLGLATQSIDEPQLLVGGFVSQIDDSVQPYGLVIPAGFVVDSASPWRMDVWLHGRGDTKTEIPFLRERMTKVGHYSPADTIVLHPFGRHCNAFKFAGERDVYEAIDHVKNLVNIDSRRTSIRGFSMGGAGCWHLAVHDSARWFAANPGAGFVDTLVYQGWNDDPPFALDEVQQKLLHWYDVLPWVVNLKNTHVVAYSGEVDKQKQAADRVLEASKKAGFDWPYVVGKGMAHKIDPVSAKQIDETMQTVASEALPQPRKEIEFVTYTLRYSRADWLSVTGLSQHWEPGRVKANILSKDAIEIQTEGVTRVAMDFRQSGWPEGIDEVRLTIDGEKIAVFDQSDEPGLQCDLTFAEQWHQTPDQDRSLRKKPGLQGPIDDAFCDRFVFVVPSRPAAHGVVQRWIDRELAYAQDRWRRLMRGNVRIVKDSELTEDDIESNHLVCFGDFGSNLYLRNIVSQLPIRWTRDEIRVGDKVFDPSTHAPVFCFPNPQNRDRYVVVNSGMTFREFSNNSNSRQIAMLPDWAVLDVSEEDDTIYAGKVVAKGFFDERWEL